MYFFFTNKICKYCLKSYSGAIFLIHLSKIVAWPVAFRVQLCVISFQFKSSCSGKALGVCKRTFVNKLHHEDWGTQTTGQRGSRGEVQSCKIPSFHLLNKQCVICIHERLAKKKRNNSWMKAMRSPIWRLTQQVKCSKWWKIKMASWIDAIFL